MVSVYLSLILIFCIVLIKAGALAWASLAWVSLCCVSLIALSLTQSFKWPHPRQMLAKTVINARLTFIAFIAFQAWSFIQHFTVSLDKTASFDQSLIGFGMMVLLIIWFNALTQRRAIFYFFITLTLIAILQSIYGFWVVLSGADQLLWMPKHYYLDRPTGFFVNANHFAAYLLLAIFFCMASQLTQPKPRQSLLLINVLDQVYSPLNGVILILLITLVASKSIGALVAFAVVMMMVFVQVFLTIKRKGVFLVFLSSLLLLCTMLVLLSDYSVIQDEVSGLSHTLHRRWALSKAAFTMLQDHWLVGIGGGAFYSQFSVYRTLEIGNNYYNYAHNDILQFWIEYGLIGITLLTIFLLGVLKDNIAVLKESKIGHQAAIAYASIYSIIGVIVHSLVDFPLHIPGFSVCFLMLISTNSLLSLNHSANVSREQKN